MVKPYIVYEMKNNGLGIVLIIMFVYEGPRLDEWIISVKIFSDKDKTEKLDYMNLFNICEQAIERVNHQHLIEHFKEYFCRLMGQIPELLRLKISHEGAPS